SKPSIRSPQRSNALDRGTVVPALSELQGTHRRTGNQSRRTGAWLLKTFFTADLHLQHEGVLAMSGRRFDSIEEHDDHLIEQINSTVAWNDRLFLLGDICWRQFDSYAKKIRCTNLHLIVGNHDRASFDKNVKTCQDVDLIQVQGHKVFLSHY